MTAESIEIRVSQSGAQTVRREIEDIGHSAEGAEKFVEALKSALEFAGLAAGIHELVEAMDEFTNLQNKLKSVGTSAQDLGVVWSKLLDISRQTYNSIETTATMYSRLELSLKSLGYSQREVLDLTRELSAAMTMSGSTGQEAKYGLMDLVHGMSAGTITGRELRGVLQDLPKVAETLAAGLSKVQGHLITIGELRGMTEGHKKISTDMIAQAFKAEDADLMRQMADYTPTISNALTVLQTQWQNFVGQLSTSSGLARDLAGAILFLADNFETLGKAIEAIGVAMFVLKGLPAIIGMVTGALRTMTAAALANPFTAIAAAVTVTAAAVYTLRDAIKLGIDDTTSLGDLVRAAWEQIGPMVRGVKAELLGMVPAMHQAFDGGTVMDWVNAVAKGLDVAAAYVGLAVVAMRSAFTDFGAVVEFTFLNLVQKVLDAVTAMANGTSHILNHLPGVNLGDAPGVQVLPPGLAEQQSEMFRRQRTELGNAQTAVDRARAGQGALATGVRDILPRAQEIGRDRTHAAALANDASRLDVHGERHEGTDAEAGKAREKLEKELERLRDKFDGTAKAVDEYNDALKTVQKAEASGLLSKSAGDDLMGKVKTSIADGVLDKYDAARKATADWNRELATLGGTMRAGLITQDEYSHAVAVGTERVKDATDPLGAVYRALDRQAQVLGQVGDAQRVESQYQTEAHALLAKGVVLNGEQERTLRARLAAQEQLQRVSQAEGTLYQQINGPQEAYKAQLEALNRLYSEGKVGAEDYQRSLTDIKLAYADSGHSVGDGFEAGMLSVSKTVNETAGLAKQTITDAFRGAEDAVVHFAQTGQLNLKNLFSTIAGDLARLSLREGIEKPLMKLFGLGGDGGADSKGGGGLLGNLLGKVDGGALGGLLGKVKGWLFGKDSPATPTDKPADAEGEDPWSAGTADKGDTWSKATDAVSKGVTDGMTTGSHTLGDTLTSAFHNFTASLGNLFNGLLTGMGNFAQGLLTGMGNFAQGLLTGLGNLAQGLLTGLGNFAQGLLTGLGNFAQGLLTGLGNFAQGLLTGLGKFADGLGSGLGKLAQGAGAGVGALAQGAGTGVGALAQGAGIGIGGAASGIGAGIGHILGGLLGNNTAGSGTPESVTTDLMTVTATSVTVTGNLINGGGGGNGLTGGGDDGSGQGGGLFDTLAGLFDMHHSSGASTGAASSSMSSKPMFAGEIGGGDSAKSGDGFLGQLAGKVTSLIPQTTEFGKDASKLLSAAMQDFGGKIGDSISGLFAGGPTDAVNPNMSAGEQALVHSANATSDAQPGALSGIKQLWPFATGGDFDVGGIGGTDSQVVAFRATPGERVVVQTPSQANRASSSPSGPSVVMHVHAADAASFQQSRGQIAAQMAAALARANYRNN